MPIPKENQIPIKEIKEINMIDHKLKNVVVAQKTETVKEDPKKGSDVPIKLIEKKADPYREPF